MTIPEFIAAYDKLARESRDISLQIKPFTDSLDDIEAEQSDLSKTPEIIDSVTPLRAGQLIECAIHHKDGSVEWLPTRVTAVCGAHLTYHGPSDGIEVYLNLQIDGRLKYRVLHPQPGEQWRYPEAACAASLGGGEEVRS